MKYTASLDKTAKWITIITSMILLFVIVMQFIDIQEEGKLILVGVVVILGVAYLLAWILHPINYKIDEKGIIVHRPAADIRISRSKVQSIEVIDKDDLKKTMRTFGVGGLFGYFGKFANRKIGSMTWYMTRRDVPVLIKTSDGRKILLSPDEPERFVNDYKAS